MKLITNHSHEKKIHQPFISTGHMKKAMKEDYFTLIKCNGNFICLCLFTYYIDINFINLVSQNT
jgi:hypothetical protein